MRGFRPERLDEKVKKNRVLRRFIRLNILFFIIFAMVIVSLFNIIFGQLRYDVSLKYAEKHAAIFSKIAGFDPEFDIKARSFIIDENGYVQLSSITYRAYDHVPQETIFHIDEVIEDPNFIEAIREYLQNIEHFLETDTTKLVSVDEYPFYSVRIEPINENMWSVVTLFRETTILTITDFAPLLLLLFVALIIFVITINVVSDELIFAPLWKLVKNLKDVKDEKDNEIYGFDRQDEVGELSKAIKELFHEAHVDSLTGVYNRRHMERTLPTMMKLLSRSKGNLSMLLVDVDYFKEFNDAYGHDAGDICLKAIAEKLDELVARTEDLVIRYGGDEFLVVLPNTDETGARMVSEKLLAGVLELNIPHGESPIADYITISIGAVSDSVSQTDKWQSYVTRADEALYMSKNNVRHSYTLLNLR
jgi:diguanylate cyclase (GGDEF)-like protein